MELTAETQKRIEVEEEMEVLLTTRKSIGVIKELKAKSDQATGAIEDNAKLRHEQRELRENVR